MTDDQIMELYKEEQSLYTDYVKTMRGDDLAHTWDRPDEADVERKRLLWHQKYLELREYVSAQEMRVILARNTLSIRAKRSKG